ncbi:NAD-dependent epimerase/dehydratase family protein [Humibacter ginsenosidimutans]|uniref:NAD(P)-dependent oxidoreductase n=1 Tax=Humibacter ginsenosidimutans TaxID=2599293 RepID=A0A5B8M3R3_9MICO|nr:NAD(P)-dependent oxidoreductase [Humibacter ginsenosidimutans]QDZ14220.1 NAD(P)-dependent oxidoreductase [Humibacter ginsenosidimutans]
MRILLAGGAGAIGRELTPALVAAGHEVWATSRSAAKGSVIAGAGGHPLVMDVYDVASIDAAFEAARPDVLLHELTDLGEYDVAANSRIRIEGTSALLDAAAGHGVERVIAQSISWVVADGDSLAEETEPLRPGIAPGAPELEQAVLAQPHGVVLRYGQFYGPGTWRSSQTPATPEALRLALAPMAEVSSFVHVADAAAATVLALGWPGGVVNVVDDEPAIAAEWMPVLAAALGAPSPEVPASLPHGRPISNALARSRGFAPRFASWREGFVSPDGGVVRSATAL